MASASSERRSQAATIQMLEKDAALAGWQRRRLPGKMMWVCPACKEPT